MLEFLKKNSDLVHRLDVSYINKADLDICSFSYTKGILCCYSCTYFPENVAFLETIKNQIFKRSNIKD